MEKIDIKALARELKEGHDVPTPGTNSERNVEIKQSKQKRPPKKSTIHASQFEDLVMKVNQRNDFNSDGCVYIDSDLHEVLRHMKLRNKLKVGYLVSWLIEQFILEHHKDIAVLIKPKENRFMDA